MDLWIVDKVYNKIVDTEIITGIKIVIIVIIKLEIKVGKSQIIYFLNWVIIKAYNCYYIDFINCVFSLRKLFLVFERLLHLVRNCCFTFTNKILKNKSIERI